VPFAALEHLKHHKDDLDALQDIEMVKKNI
jgi:hypothetical protein